ncbi:MAG TPA: 16S rRNA (guanine(527)-N(7))-methyltransferase RsmG [Solirubrobacteraceae bacterium]|jgi:16S rRNA (guanine527-N7)-methyltransferase|nr:16S rRNA (guanine(527)-N(7))-methyltransferase RsmG [Solirubrobacteraceae bacterium]
MSAETLHAGIAELVERYDLDAHQGEQIGELLALLEAEARAPSSVRSPELALDVHVADSLVALELAAARGARALADLGSGAGFPGLPLAIALSDGAVTLVESQARKCRYLERAIAELGLANARVVCARAEEWSAGAGASDAVLARALAPQAVVLEYAAPLLRLGGALVDWRGKRSAADEQSAQEACPLLGMALQEIRRVQPFASARERHLHVFIKVAETPPRFPRRAGVARRRPMAVTPADRPRKQRQSRRSSGAIDAV